LTKFRMGCLSSHTERAAHVLVVDQSVDKSNPATESRGRTTGRQVFQQELHQLLRVAHRVVGQRHLVKPTGAKAGLCQPSDQIGPTVLHITDDMRRHVPDTPPPTKAWVIPLLHSQRRQEVGHLGHLGPLLAGHRHHVHEAIVVTRAIQIQRRFCPPVPFRDGRADQGSSRGRAQDIRVDNSVTWKDRVMSEHEPLHVIVVGRDPEKMEPAVAVLESAGSQRLGCSPRRRR